MFDLVLHRSQIYYNPMYTDADQEALDVQTSIVHIYVPSVNNRSSLQVETTGSISSCNLDC